MFTSNDTYFVFLINVWCHEDWWNIVKFLDPITPIFGVIVTLYWFHQYSKYDKQNHSVWIYIRREYNTWRGIVICIASYSYSRSPHARWRKVITIGFVVWKILQSLYLLKYECTGVHFFFTNLRLSLWLYTCSINFKKCSPLCSHIFSDLYGRD